MRTNKRNFTCFFALLLAVLMLAVSLPMALHAASIGDAVASDDAPPIVATVPSAGGDFTVETVNEEHFLFLPGTVDLTAVTVRYTGAKQLYLPETEGMVAPEGTAVYDFSDGLVTVYEYDSSSASYTSYSLKVMQGAEIPSMYITVDPVEHGNQYKNTLDWLHAYKDNETTGTLYMVDGEGNVLYDGILDTFKGRGNTSFVAPGIQKDQDSEKKSYNIKLDKKTELIPGTGKMKKWSLVHMRISEAYHYDWTGLCYRMGLQTFDKLVGEEYFSNKTQYVDLYLDGEYRGAYILIERLDNGAAVDITDNEDYVSSESSAKKTVTDPSDPAIMAGVRYYRYTAHAQKTEDFDITGGYLLETNFNNLEECGFVTAQGMHFDLKAPDTCIKEQVQFIAKYVQDFENALYSETGYNAEGKHYSEYVDLESLADMILTYAYYQNWELFRTSTYAYLDVANSAHPVLTFGPAWDFETGASILEDDHTFFGQHNTYEDTQQYMWLEQLWQKGDFMQILAAQAEEMDLILDASLGLGDAVEGIQTAQGFIDEAHDSLVMNWSRWGLEAYLNSNSKYRGHENDFDYYATTYIAALQARKAVWDTFWDEGLYVYGVSIAGNREKESGKTALTCTVQSDALLQYQWYRVGADHVSGELVEGATGAYYVATEPGEYYCVVTGGNNAYNPKAEGEIFASEYLSIASKAFHTADATEVDKFPDDEHVPGEWETVIEADCEQDGLRVKRCAKCEGKEVLVSETIPATGHDDGEWIVVVEPTTVKGGVRELRCIKCETVIKRELLDKLFANPFTDVDENRWYFKAVEFAVVNELFNGVSTTEFAPDSAMTRGMLVTVLARLEGVEINNEQPTGFTDVRPGKYYSGSVVWAAEQGIVNGVADKKYAPDNYVTREQTAAILYRYAEYKGIAVTERADLSAYEDADQIHDYAKDALSWVNAKGIVKGVTETTLAPRKNCTRAQVAEMLRLYVAGLPAVEPRAE